MSLVYFSEFYPSEVSDGAKGSASFPSTQDGVTAILTVPAAVVQTEADGSGGNYSASGGTMILRRGSVVLTPVFSIVSRNPNTSWITINSSTGVYAVTDPGVSSAQAVLRASVDGVNYDITYGLVKAPKGINGSNGSNGSNGISGISAYLTNESHSVFAYANGIVINYTGATGSFVVMSGTTDISSSFTLSTVSNPQGLSVNYTGRTYTITGGMDANEDSASLTIRATGGGAWAGVVLDKVFSLSKTRGGYEVVSSLPTVGDPRRFEGSVVFLTTDDKLYRFNGSDWVASVPTSDLSGEISAAQIAAGAITTDKIAAGAITAAKLATSELITSSAQIGNGVITNAKIGNLEVDSAKIANLTVGTDKIALQSVTRVVALNSSSTLIPSAGVWTNYGSGLTINVASGTSVRLDVSTRLLQQVSSSFESSAEMRILRNGTPIYNTFLNTIGQVGITIEVDGGFATANLSYNMATTPSILWVDVHGTSGNVTYSVQVKQSGGASFQELTFIATEIRR